MPISSAAALLNSPTGGRREPGVAQASPLPLLSLRQQVVIIFCDASFKQPNHKR